MTESMKQKKTPKGKSVSLRKRMGLDGVGINGKVVTFDILTNIETVCIITINRINWGFVE